jgi:DNA (cytosine-5)-methyltransferase 1
VLRKHWPEVKRFRDVRKVKEFPYCDVLFGGFPCQPVSRAGKRQAQEDDRWLWPEFHRAIDQVRPAWVVIENVEGLRTHGLLEILQGLAQSGYNAEWDHLPAGAFGAPHLRYRLFVVAYPQRRNCGTHTPIIFDERWYSAFRDGNYIASYSAIREGSATRVTAKAKAGKRKMGITRLGIAHGRGWPLEPGICRVANGTPYRLDRLGALGNAVVPRVAEWIGRRIMEAA